MIDVETRLACLKLAGDHAAGGRVAEAETFLAFITGQSELDRLMVAFDKIRAAFSVVRAGNYDKELALFVLGDELAKAFRNAGLSEDIAYIDDTTLA